MVTDRAWYHAQSVCDLLGSEANLMQSIDSKALFGIETPEGCVYVLLTHTPTQT